MAWGIPEQLDFTPKQVLRFNGGYVVVGVDGELSIRIYDDNLKQNIDSSTEYDPEPFEPDHPYFYDY